jgi:hypothetical protein
MEYRKEMADVAGAVTRLDSAPTYGESPGQRRQLPDPPIFVR